MKQLYTILACLLLALPSVAKELTFYIGDTPIKPGESVVFTGVKEMAQGPKKTMVIYDPGLSLGADWSTSNVTVTMESLSGDSFQLCAGGTCENNTKIVKTGVGISKGGKIPMQFEFSGIYANDEIQHPTVSARLEAKDDMVKDSKREFTITMGPDASVTIIETTAPFSIDNRTLVYHLGDKTGSVSIYDATGRQRISKTVTGSGCIDLSALPAGLYIYRTQGIACDTTKFILN